jgi:hypothetical protein
LKELSWTAVLWDASLLSAVTVAFLKGLLFITAASAVAAAIAVALR